MYPTLYLTFIKLQTVNFIDKDVNLIESMSLDKQGNVRRNRNSMFCRTKRNDISRTECIRLSHRISRNTHASQQTGQPPITFPQPIRPQPPPLPASPIFIQQHRKAGRCNDPTPSPGIPTDMCPPHTHSSNKTGHHGSGVMGLPRELMTLMKHHTEAGSE